jgi:hypothetical protein
MEGTYSADGIDHQADRNHVALPETDEDNDG